MIWHGRRGPVAAVLLAAVALTGGEARADDKALDKGIALYDSLEYEKAQVKLEAVMADKSASRRDVSRAALYLGLIHVSLGDNTAGEAYFGVALSLDSTLAMPSGTSPKISTVFDRIRQLKLPAVRTQAPLPVRRTDEPTADAPREQPHVPSRPRQSGRSLPWWTIGTLGLTMVSAGIATKVGLDARATRDEIEREPHLRSELETLRDDLDTQATTANILFAVTGALAMSTVVVYLAERSDGRDEEQVRVSGSAGAGGAWVEATWRF